MDIKKINLKDRKTVLLLILAVVVVISLVRWGCVPIGGRTVQGSKGGSAAEPERRHAKQTEFKAWGRNPFTAKRIPGLGTSGKIILTGIVKSGGGLKAIINEALVGKGETIMGSTVVDIKKDSVILNDGVGNYEVQLWEEGYNAKK